MELTLAVLADDANISREGKLNILGIFDAIYSAQFPAIHPRALLIIRFEADISEAESKKTVEIKLIDDDGQQTVLSVLGEIALGKPEPGELLHAVGLIQLNNLVFPHPGHYAFKILVNGDHKGDVPFKVVETKDKNTPQIPQ